MSLSRWIWSVNAERRHLTPDQLAAAIVMRNALELSEAAKARQLEAGQQQGAHGKEGGRGHAKPLPMNSSEGVSEAPVGARKHSGDTRKVMAQEAQVSEYKIGQAQNLKKHAPELLEDVKQGKTSLRKAARQARQKAGNTKQPTSNSAERRSVKNADTAITAGELDLKRVISLAVNGVRKIMRDLPGQSRESFLQGTIYFLEKLRKPVDARVEDEPQGRAG
jgi:hypothetical protein